MKTQFAKNTLLATLLLAVSSIAFADDASLTTGGYARQLHKTDMMKMIDADGNHMVTKAEFNEYYSTLFDALDKDTDGSLDAKEWVGTKRNETPSLTTGGYNRELRSMKMMKMMDSDGDHKVTKAEFLDHQGLIFAAMDSSGKGELSVKDWIANTFAR